MRLKTLEMSGFKSFVDRTTVQFEAGITGVVGPNGCGKCVHGDTLVTLSNGSQLPIRTLVEEALGRADAVECMDDGEYTYDNPDDISVAALDTQNFKMSNRPVIAFVRRTGPENLLKVTTKSGRTVTATEYHPFFIHEDGKLRAIRADELKAGIRIATPRYLPVHDEAARFTAIAADEPELTTRLVAVDNMLVTERVRIKPLKIVTRLSSDAVKMRKVAPLNSEFDTVPGVEKLFSELWDLSGSRIDRKHPLRGRMEVYRSGNCSPSRDGLTEAVDYIRKEAKNWDGSCEGLASRLERLTASDIYWDEIVAVEKVAGDEWVYDLCVEGDHNFVANDLIVHNSNIVDAIRWVMGEMSAKHLRGSEMQDVIFNGCETRPPTGMSQVMLTFDNSDGRAPADYASYSEIQIGRRLYRSGESEYFINKTPCRLKDIIDIFLGTGVGTKAYSIIEQGMIGTIVSAKPEDRRMLIEEAAGISKFKARKEAALRKMDSTRANLARLNDILSELTRHINSLNRQAKKAERHQKISSELKEKELALAATRHKSMRVETETLASELTRLRETETSASAELSGYEAELEAKRLALAETERELDGVQQDLYRAEHSIKLYESEINHREQETERLKGQNNIDARELEAFKLRLVEINEEIEKANSAMVSADLKLADSSEVVARFDAEVEAIRSGFSMLQTECDGLKSQAMNDGGAISNLNSTIDHLERRNIDITGRIARDQAEIDAIDKRREQITGEISRNEGEVGGSKQLKFKLEEESGSLQNELDAQRIALAGAEERLSSIKNDAGEKRARLNSLKELRKNLEGYRDGVRAVIQRAGTEDEKLKGILGTVSECVETEAEYEPALGAVLGEKLQCVVVRSHQEGVEAIDYLRSAACGRSSFIPLGVRASESTGTVPEGEGVVGPLTNFVRFADDYKHVCRHLLGDVVLVDDLRCALNLWEKGSYRNTFVTRDGCVVDPSGIVTGGSESGVEEQLIAQKRKVKELEEELSLLGGELTAAEGETQKLRDRVRSLEGQVEALRRDAHGKELRLVGQESNLARQKDELFRYESERDKLTVETAALAEELAEIERERTDAKLRIGQHTSDKEIAEKRLSEVVSSLESLAGDKDRKERELIDFKVELAKARERASTVEREIANLVKTKTETVLGVDRRLADISASNTRLAILAREVETLKLDLDMAIRSIAGLKESQRTLSERYEEGSSALRERELSIREIRKRHDEALSQFHGVELKLTEQRGRLQYLSDNIRERYHLDLGHIEAEYARDGLNMDEEERIVAELKEKLDSIGSVNVDAIQEFEELSVRHEFLTRQNADLTASLDNLSKAIAKINRTSRQRFRKAFEDVDNQFQKLFPKLFRGGQAKLMLTDEENLLETGVEIIAQPPGKKLQSITLLSGGEKALTAVALIFSIFFIKPSPFCLLDEVDAPLDDANVDRFNDLIRSMTHHSQFILITHNKRTMELADLLYGVTMEERGVSKMVSVKLGVDKEKEPESAVA